MNCIEFKVLVEDSVFNRAIAKAQIKSHDIWIVLEEGVTIINDDGTVWGDAYVVSCKGSKENYEAFKKDTGLKVVPGPEYILLAEKNEEA